MEKFSQGRIFNSWVVFVGISLLLAWLLVTPPGLLGKVDALGYAVCHRIADHSFSISDRQLPLCARCTGMYLGALVGLIYFMPRCRKAGFPPLKILVVFGVFLAAFALDGANSFLDLLNERSFLYMPQNVLRLLTGTMVGLAAAAMLAAVVGQSAWLDFENTPILSGFGQLGGLVGIALLVDLAILSGNVLLVYPLAVLSGLSVLLFLGLAYSIVWLNLLNRWNSFSNWNGFWPLLGSGLCTALLQILVTDLVRLGLTGTWGGLIF